MNGKQCLQAIREDEVFGDILFIFTPPVHCLMLLKKTIENGRYWLY
jgi:hypothetical protein